MADCWPGWEKLYGHEKNFLMEFELETGMALDLKDKGWS